MRKKNLIINSESLLGSVLRNKSVLHGYEPLLVSPSFEEDAEDVLSFTWSGSGHFSGASLTLDVKKRAGSIDSVMIVLPRPEEAVADPVALDYRRMNEALNGCQKKYWFLLRDLLESDLLNEGSAIFILSDINALNCPDFAYRCSLGWFEQFTYMANSACIPRGISVSGLISANDEAEKFGQYAFKLLEQPVAKYAGKWLRCPSKGFFS